MMMMMMMIIIIIIIIIVHMSLTFKSDWDKIAVYFMGKRKIVFTQWNGKVKAVAPLIYTQVNHKSHQALEVHVLYEGPP